MINRELADLFAEREELLAEQARDRAQRLKAEAAASVRDSVQREVDALNAASRGALRNWAQDGCQGDPPPVEEDLMSAANRKLVIAEQIAGASQGAVAYIDEELARINTELIENRARRESCVARLMADEFMALGNRVARWREQLAEGEDRLRAAREYFRDLGEKFRKEHGARHQAFDEALAAANAGLPPEDPHVITAPDNGDVKLMEAEFLSRVFGEDREVVKATVNGEAAQEEAVHA